jgi:hypothetical protein
MRNIELSTWESVPHKLDSLKKSLENIYEVKLDTCSLDIPLDKLYPTEDFLENDKLALVFKKIIEEDYDVPIVIDLVAKNIRSWVSMGSRGLVQKRALE